MCLNVGQHDTNRSILVGECVSRPQVVNVCVGGLRILIVDLSLRHDSSSGPRTGSGPSRVPTISTAPTGAGSTYWKSSFHNDTVEDIALEKFQLLS